MKEKYLKQLYDCRLIRTDEEFYGFEESIEKLVDLSKSEDIPRLCEAFDDNTEEFEVMYGLIHLVEDVETLRETENSYLLLKSMVKMDNAIEWRETLIYRTLNHPPSRNLLKKNLSLLDEDERQKITNLLLDIKTENPEQFGTKIDEVLS